MKKAIITSALLLLITSIYSQSKEITFKTEGKRTVLSREFARNGDFFFEKGNNVISSKGQKRKLFKYNSNLEKVFEVDIKPTKGSYSNRYNPYFGIAITNDGKYVFDGDWIIDEKGASRYYNFKKDRSGNINDLFSFPSNTYYSYIGPKKGRKNKKKKYSGGDIYIFTRKNSDLSTAENMLEVAPVKSNIKKGKAISWYVGESFDDYFNLLAKDDINKERTIDTYHVASYNYNGKLLAYTPLTVKLKNAHIMLSTNGGPTIFVDKNFGAFASGNIYTDTKTGDMFVYGYYTDRAKKKMIMGKYKGFYLAKFDSKGTMLWTKQVPIKGHKFLSKTLNASQAHIYYNKIDDDKGIIRVNSNKGGINTYTFDTSKGELVNTNIGVLVKKSIISSYTNKKLYPKKSFSYEAASAVSLKKSIKDYITKLNSKKKIYFDAKILENGSIILTHDNFSSGNKIKDKVIKILKFDE